MNLFVDFLTTVLTVTKDLQKKGILPKDLPLGRIVVEPTKDPQHGDLATNVAMVLSKIANMPPKVLADYYLEALQTHEDIQAAQVEGPGFINLRLTDAFWGQQLREILREGESFGTLSIGQGEKVNVEYVSANPTGPLHIGHCRVAVVGDVLANLLEKAGYEVTREYYINDTGGQANDLARSVYNRYLEALGRPVGAPGAYGGEYLISIGQQLAQSVGDKWVSCPESDWLPEVRRFGVEAMMQLIKKDLEALNIHQNVFSSERSLVEAGKVDEAIEVLSQKNLIYQGILEKPKGQEIDDWEPRQQLLFRATQFGDDTDRAIKKSDGSWTYFAGDMAYHLDKLQRTGTTLVNVWGADHGGYVQRLTSAVKALSGGKAKLVCLLCQMVRFMMGGEVLKMSKRAGNFITVHQALEKVGLDAMRFMMVSRKNDMALDFDFEKAVEQSKDNPVFYVQYAFARCHSIKRHARSLFPSLAVDSKSLSTLSFEELETPDFLELIKKLAAWPRTIEMAARAYEPHRIAYYLGDLAGVFHALWNKGKENLRLRFIDETNPTLTQKHLALIEAIVLVLHSGLTLLGVAAREEM